MADDVLVRDEGAVRLLTLNRPDRLNAFTAEGYRALREALVDADGDGGVRVVVLTGAGRGFSSGVDLNAIAGSGVELGKEFDALLEVLTVLTKPLIAAVNGVAVGFGMTILPHCDLVLIDEEARLRAPFAVLGTAAEAGSSVLFPEVVGPQRAAEILYTARWVPAAEAVEMGLALRTCPSGQVVDEAMALATEIAAHAPEAVASSKRLLRHGRADGLRAAFARERVEAGVIGRAVGPMPDMSTLRRS
jgi:enoyl-CoA hydratase/carnithine racemase